VPNTGVNVNRVLMVRPVQEMEKEACTGHVSCQEVERRGLDRILVRKACFGFLTGAGEEVDVQESIRIG
jgi:hypothetical protein